jgi:hypothetical protein
MIILIAHFLRASVRRVVTMEQVDAELAHYIEYELPEKQAMERVEKELAGYGDYASDDDSSDSDDNNQKRHSFRIWDPVNGPIDDWIENSNSGSDEGTSRTREERNRPPPSMVLARWLLQRLVLDDHTARQQAKLLRTGLTHTHTKGMAMVFRQYTNHALPWTNIVHTPHSPTRPSEPFAMHNGGRIQRIRRTSQTTTKHYLEQQEAEEERQCHRKPRPPNSPRASTTNERREQRMHQNERREQRMHQRIHARRHQQHAADRQKKRREECAAAHVRYDKGCALQAMGDAMADVEEKGDGKGLVGTIEKNVNGKSMREFSAAFAEFLRLLGPDHPAVTAAYTNMLRVLERQVDGNRGLAGAMRRYEQALRDRISWPVHVGRGERFAEKGASFCAMEDVLRQHSVAVGCCQTYETMSDKLVAVAGPEHRFSPEAQHGAELICKTRQQLQAAAHIFDAAYQDAIKESHHQTVPFTRNA